MARVAVVTGGTRGIGHAISIALKNKGFRVAANYAGNDAAAQQFQAETGIPGLQVGRRRLRRLRRRLRSGRQGTRPDRRAGQQRRHHARRHAAPDDQGELGRGHPHQSRLRLQHDAPGDRRHAHAQLRPHHQHLLHQRPQGPDGAGQLLRRQGRPARLHQGRGARRRRKGITVNVIAPGYIATEMVRGRAEGSARDQDPAADPGRPSRHAEEIARCVVFLAADDAGFITGACLDANGGQYMAT